MDTDGHIEAATAVHHHTKAIVTHKAAIHLHEKALDLYHAGEHQLSRHFAHLALEHSIQANKIAAEATK